MKSASSRLHASSPVKKNGLVQSSGIERKPSLPKIINTLKCAIEKLQLAQGLEVEKARQLTLENYIGQVELLQTAFTSLADAVLEELDNLGNERLKAQCEQAAHEQCLHELEERVQSKFNQLRSLEERLDVKLAVVAELPHQVDGVFKQQAAAQTCIEALSKEVKRLHVQLHQLEHQQSIAASEAAVAPLNPIQRTQVKEYACEQVQQHVPGMVSTSIAGHVPSMIDESVEAAARSLRHDVASTTELLATDIAHLAKDTATMRSDMAAVAGSIQQQQHELGVLAPRLSRLESLEASNPRASLRLVTALEGKVDNLAAQQARYSKSVEGVVAALVEDTVALNKSSRQLEGLVSHQQGQLQDTKEALLRSAKVFSQLLKIPSPVSTTLWSASSPVRGSLAAAASSPRAMGAYSPHGSPMKPAMVTTTTAAPHLMSKYSTLLNGLN